MNNTKEENILIMLRNQATVREIKDKLHTGAEKINKIRETNQGKFPEIKVKKNPRTIKKIKEQEQEQEHNFIPNSIDSIKIEDNKITQLNEELKSRTRTELRTRAKLKPNIFFTEREKQLTRKMFRAVIRQRAIKITEEDEYQKLIDKITGD